MVRFEYPSRMHNQLGESTRTNQATIMANHDLSQQMLLQDCWMVNFIWLISIFRRATEFHQENIYECILVCIVTETGGQDAYWLSIRSYHAIIFRLPLGGSSFAAQSERVAILTY